jgi:hypothetical protein
MIKFIFYYDNHERVIKFLVIIIIFLMALNESIFYYSNHDRNINFYYDNDKLIKF